MVDIKEIVLSLLAFAAFIYAVTTMRSCEDRRGVLEYNFCTQTTPTPPICEVKGIGQ